MVPKLIGFHNSQINYIIATPEITAESYEVSPSLLNLITREQFGGSAMEDTLNELLNYPEYLLPFMAQVVGLKEQASETIMVMKEKKVEEVKMLIEVKEPLLDLDNCSLHELISILQKFASDPSINLDN